MDEEVVEKITVELTPEECKMLEMHRLKTGSLLPDRRKMESGITYKADAFAREVAKMPGEVLSTKELAKAYLRVAKTKKPWDRVKDFMSDERVLKRIQAYKKVYATDRDVLLADRESLVMELKESWDEDKVISTGERTCTPKVKTSDLLTAYKDREILYIGDASGKKESAEPKVVINITGDVKALVEKAQEITDAEIIKVEGEDEKR